MIGYLASGLMICTSGLIAHALLPTAWANRWRHTLRLSTTALLAIQCLIATLFAIQCWMIVGRQAFRTSVSMPLTGGYSASLYADWATHLMLGLVSFVGLVVSRFSIRYLDGELSQGSYFKWLAVTVGAVSWMVISGNLLQFVLFWIATSLGLHQLLLHYPQRQAAQRAAWTKFAISRFGDAMLVVALVLTYRAWGTFDLAELFTLSRAIAEEGQATWFHASIGWLFVLGAATKSAQLPFHTWLPNTMETPTPVSALMHAGVVNAGGYLVIRLSPLLVLSPSALSALAVLGGLTACLAGLMMMTQSSIKKSLAYSTIAQMGFMMLQCGLGAFSAAMVHIVAHSLYKAHAFLSSGSVLNSASLNSAVFGSQQFVEGVVVRGKPVWAAMRFVIVLLAVCGMYGSVMMLLGVNPWSKAGGLALAFSMCLALTTWCWRVATLSGTTSLLSSFASVAVLCCMYGTGYLLVDHLLQPSLPTTLRPQYLPLLLCVVFGCSLLFAVQLAFQATPSLSAVAGPSRVRSGLGTWLTRLRVHALNGFYFDALIQRFTSSAVRL